MLVTCQPNFSTQIGESIFLVGKAIVAAVPLRSQKGETDTTKQRYMIAIMLILI